MSIKPDLKIGHWAEYLRKENVCQSLKRFNVANKQRWVLCESRATSFSVFQASEGEDLQRPLLGKCTIGPCWEEENQDCILLVVSCLKGLILPPTS